LFETKEWHDFTIEVHALKSASLSCGCVGLSEKAKRIELACKGGDYDVAVNETDELLKTYSEVLKVGTEYLRSKGFSFEETEAEQDAATEEILPEMQCESIIALLNEAANACDDFYADIVVSNIEEICKYSYQGTNLNTLLKEARALADEYEYDKVKEILVNLADELQRGAD